MKTSSAMDITIMGREFRVTCPDEEREELLQTVAYVDKNMREIRDGGKVVGSERVAIMAALNITHELLTIRKRGNFDMGEFKRRIDCMQAVLDAAMPEQDKLF
ncbi:MAG: cell division protein ZapA [Nitrosospira sp.]